MLRIAIAAVALSTAPLTASAEGWSLTSADAGFQRVEDRDSFVRLVNQGSLKRFGITLKVVPDGRIVGRAFGRDVTGVWDWRDGYFCRDMNWGSRALGPNCQEVRVSGSVVRFTSDEGAGRFADLKLD